MSSDFFLEYLCFIMDYGVKACVLEFVESGLRFACCGVGSVYACVPVFGVYVVVWWAGLQDFNEC